MNKIYQNVHMGEGTVVEDFAVIGAPPRGKQDGECKTVIGKNCTIKSGSVIYANTTLGDNCFIAHGAIIREDCTIGDNFVLGNNSVVLPDATIEDHVTIHTLAEIADHSTIKHGAWIGPGVKMANNIHPKQLNPCEHKDKQDKEGAPHIGTHARIGLNATINAFVHIHDYAIVGSGAVVTKDVPAHHVVIGNPAKVVKDARNITCRYCDNKPYRVKDE